MSRLFKDLFDSASIAMAIADSRGLVLERNLAFTRLLPFPASYPDQESGNISIISWLQGHNAPLVPFHFSGLVNGTVDSLRFETPFTDEGGKKRLLEIKAWRLPTDGEKEDNPLFCLQIEDSTKRKEEAKQLLKAKELAERSTETKSQFLANMSHEIRTPIQTMLGMTELLQDTRLDREQTEYLRQLRFSTDVLLSLINDILDYSKIEANKLVIEHIELDIESVIEQASDMVCLEAHRKELEIVIDIAPDAPRLIEGDPNRIRQVIVNLAKNAVKFTTEGSVILRLRKTTLNRKSAISITIVDTGIGISPEQRSGLFSTFFQADSSTTRRFGGTGLGLAISKHLVELFGGRIGMSDNSPAGSIFSFTFPAEPLSGTERFPLPAIKSDERILIVDDHREAREVLVSYLTAFGYATIEQASSGREALHILQMASMNKQPIGLCLIDMLMPEMDGWRLAAEINANPSINSSKLILMVPQGTLGADAKMTLLKWFNAYINKPIKRRDLAQALRESFAVPVDLDKVAADEDSLSDDEAGELEELDEVIETTVPGQGSPRRDEAALPSSMPEPRRGRVLVAEDHEINQKLLSLILERAGCSVSLAANGLEAIEAIRTSLESRSTDFDLVFMDIQMPRLNGYEAARGIRELGYSKPILAVTASALSDEKERCTEAGMDDIIVKPFHRAEILEALERWLPFDSCQNESGQRLTPATGSSSMADGDTQKAPSIQHSSARDILDRAALEEAFMGNTQTIKSLLKRYIEKTSATINTLAELLDTLDWERFLLETHTIKGSASNLAANELNEAAREAESAAREQDIDRARRSLAPLGEAFERFSREACLYLKEES